MKLAREHSHLHENCIGSPAADLESFEHTMLSSNKALDPSLVTIRQPRSTDRCPSRRLWAGRTGRMRVSKEVKLECGTYNIRLKVGGWKE